MGDDQLVLDQSINEMCVEWTFNSRKAVPTLIQELRSWPEGTGCGPPSLTLKSTSKLLVKEEISCATSHDLSNIFVVVLRDRRALEEDCLSALGDPSNFFAMQVASSISVPSVHLKCRTSLHNRRKLARSFTTWLSARWRALWIKNCESQELCRINHVKECVVIDICISLDQNVKTFEKVKKDQYVPLTVSL